MSRIFGAVSPQPGIICQMVPGITSIASWRASAVATGNCTVAWAGAGTPKLWSADGVLVALDGYICNRAEFELQGQDAEIIADSFIKSGFTETIRRLRGDFAIALYDAKDGSLWLARDRCGVKPLYYHMGSECLAFASRPRALIGMPGVSRDIRRRYLGLYAAGHYRYFDNDPEASPYADISQLPAARILRFKNGQLSTLEYWKLEERMDLDEDEELLAERYRELLFRSVESRLRLCQRPAFTLSGGMDSSSVLGSAVAITGSKQPAFSTVYSDNSCDESTEIQTMLSTAADPWHKLLIESPDVLRLVQRMIEANDEPVLTATWLSHFVLCEEAGKLGFQELFGGLGGDELNAGEYEYFPFHFADLRQAGLTTELNFEVESWIKHHNHPIFQKSWHVLEGMFTRTVDFGKAGKCLPDCVRLNRYASALDPEFWNFSSFQPVMEHPFTSYLKNRTYQDLTRETTPPCLRAEDRHSAAFGLQTHLPFLDHHLIEFMFRIQGRLKIRNGITKHLLRCAMRGVLPEETRTRVKKMGWNTPAYLWLSGAGLSVVKDLINSRRFRERGIYRIDEVNRLVEEHERIVSSCAPVENHVMFLWQLINLEIWQTYAESSAFPSRPDAPALIRIAPLEKHERC